MYHTPPYPMLRKNSVRKTCSKNGRPDPTEKIGWDPNDDKWLWAWRQRVNPTVKQGFKGTSKNSWCHDRLSKMSNSSECFMVSWYFMVSFSLDQLIHFSHLPICRISPLGALTCSKASFRAGAVSCNQLWRAWALSWFRGSGFFFWSVVNFCTGWTLRWTQMVVKTMIEKHIPTLDDLDVHLYRSL